MIIEENVDVRNEQTEEVAGATGEPQMAASNENASTVLGKFKDVDALMKAYESLQAEFTRRSQRLRTLERAAENSPAKAEASGAEKLRKTAMARRDRVKKFDKFVAENCVAKENAEGEPDQTLQFTASANDDAAIVGDKAATTVNERTEGAAVVEETGAGELTKEGVKEVSREETLPSSPPFEGSAEKEGEAVAVGNGGRLSSAANSEGAPLSSEELYEKAVADEAVRLRIVGEYLSSLGKTGAPLTSGGVGMAVTPPARAKTVGQAGNMALLYFRKPNVD